MKKMADTTRIETGNDGLHRVFCGNQLKGEYVREDSARDMRDRCNGAATLLDGFGRDRAAVRRQAEAWLTEIDAFIAEHPKTVFLAGPGANVANHPGMAPVEIRRDDIDIPRLSGFGAAVIFTPRATIASICTDRPGYGGHRTIVDTPVVEILG